MRKAKILVTLGPASSSKATISRLITSGVNAFRFNFSHGTHAEHQALFYTAKAAALEAGMHIPFIQDLQGPKIRVSLPGKKPVVLDDGADVYLSGDPDLAGADTLHIAYPPLCDDVKIGEPILMDDGKLRLVVTDIGRRRIRCRGAASPGPSSPLRRHRPVRRSIGSSRRPHGHTRPIGPRCA